MNDWHKERNFSKMRVASMIGTIKSLKRGNILTRTETAWANDALRSLKNIIDNWEQGNASSKKAFGG